MVINILKNEFLENIIVYGNSESTKRAYDFDLTKFIEYLGDRGVADIGELTIQQVKDYLRDIKKADTNEELAPTTRARVRSSLKSFLEYLYKNDYMNLDLGAKLQRVKIPQKDPAYLSKEEYLNFLKVVEREATPYYKERDLALINLLIKTGLRRAEIVSLNVEDINLETLKIRVTRKGGKEQSITIHKELAQDLKKYIKTLRRSNDQPLFMSKRNNRLSASSVWHLVKSYAKEAGLPSNITVHSLRHTYATSLLLDGLPLPYIQTLMGHRSPTTTFRYLHVANKELEDAYNNKVSFDERK